MKFIKRHINEGFFGTKAQMQAKLSREAELSDEEVIASEARSMLERKVGKIISEIFKQNQEMFEVIDFSPYSYRESYSMGSVTANMSYFIRKELSVKIDKNGNQDVIHLTLDLGGFDIGTNKIIPSTSICFPSLITSSNSTRNTANVANYKKELLKAFDPVSVKRKFCNRLRRIINTVKPKKDEQSYYDFIAGSKIVLDEITMYTDVKIDKFTIHLEDAVALTESKFINPMSKNYDDKEEVYFAYKPLVDAFVNLITFGCPVIVTAQVKRVPCPLYETKKKRIFSMRKYGYSDFGSMEDDISDNDYISLEAITSKYFKEVHKDFPTNVFKDLAREFRKCEYFELAYSTHYSGTATRQAGLVLNNSSGLLVDTLLFCNRSDSTWNAEEYISITRVNIDVDAKNSPIKLYLIGTPSESCPLQYQKTFRMEKLYEPNSIEHKSMRELLDHSIKLITTQQ